MRTTGLNIDLNQYKYTITELLREFKQRFQIFDQLETDFQVFFSPFTLNASDLPVDLQLGTIDLQCDSTLGPSLSWRAWAHSISIFFQATNGVASSKIGGVAKRLILGE